MQSLREKLLSVIEIYQKFSVIPLGVVMGLFLYVAVDRRTEEARIQQLEHIVAAGKDDCDRQSQIYEKQLRENEQQIAHLKDDLGRMKDLQGEEINVYKLQIYQLQIHRPAREKIINVASYTGR